ncbi:hypothetical protein ACGFLS_03315 [Streptomyces abikoensis]|uniref:hypothetical protein n=1 Tax=Streptomyces abikoensis TaxID=97398 RepID=UPI0037245CE9
MAEVREDRCGQALRLAGEGVADAAGGGEGVGDGRAGPSGRPAPVRGELFGPLPQGRRTVHESVVEIEEHQGRIAVLLMGNTDMHGSA